MKYKIATQLQYESIMEDIYNLMNKGESNLLPAELKQLEQMAIAAEAYEDKNVKGCFK